MRNLIICSMALGWLLLGQVSRAEDPAAVEQKVKGELKQSLDRIVGEHNYILQVTVSEDRRMERQLVEGEMYTPASPPPQPEVPPLPGFSVPIRKTEVAAGPSRQTFRMVERTEVKSVDVQLTLNESLDDGSRRRAEESVRAYISRFGGKGKLSVAVVPLRQVPQAPRSELPYWVWAALGLGLLGIAVGAWALLGGKKENRRVMYPKEIQDAELVNPNNLDGRGSFGHGLALPPARSSPVAFDDRKALAHQKAAEAQQRDPKEPAFPPIPANEEFVDRRTELLSAFLEDAGIFRNYFDRLSSGAKSELYAGLRGPAFDSLLESLDLVPPLGADTNSAPSEEQLVFYRKNFSEFVASHSWQKQQFFGFLGQMSPEQLMVLSSHQNPMVVAIMLKYMKPAQAALLLDRMTEMQRSQVLAQMHRALHVVGAELFSIEQSVRAQVESMPGFLIADRKQGADFWAKILAHSDRQDEILLDLERASPELYPDLAKFRFKLDDIPTLPKPVIARVLNEVENEELCLGLLTCTEDVRDFVLAELPVTRRQLLKEQLVMMHGVAASKSQGARAELVKRFREVMA